MAPATVTLLLLLLPLAYAHSFLTQPRPYNRVYKTISCQGSECTQACPNLKSDMPNTPTNPAATYKRGQKVLIRWAKNNHRGGLVRISLVPHASQMSRPWQARLALLHGCWESGLYRCTGELCGSDSDNEGFQRLVTIPPVFPDGVYALSVTWYGGLHFSRDRGQFPDYHSCSFVRISGGPLEASYQPFWEPGDTGKFQNGDLCQTAVDEVGKCPKSGCTGPSFWSVSKEYKGGKKPDKITPSIVADAFDTPPEFTVPNPIQPPQSPAPRRPSPKRTEPPRTQPPPSTFPGTKPPRRTRTQPRTQPPPSTPPRTKPPRRTRTQTQPSPSTTRRRRKGGRGHGGKRGRAICLGDVCCPAKCGKCGGQDCHKRPGGGANCCYTMVQKSGRKCKRDPPPCLRER